MDGGKYLFLGGPYDGEWRHVGADYVNIASLDDKDVVSFHQYRSLRLAGDVSEQIVYVEASLTPDDMVRMLVQNYRPEKGDE